MAGELGNRLEAQAAAETHALQPPHQYVPWVGPGCARPHIPQIAIHVLYAVGDWNPQGPHDSCPPYTVVVERNLVSCMYVCYSRPQ